MFDMNQCKPGDKLVSCHGSIFTYIKKNENGYPYPHIVEYSDGGYGSRTDDGFVYSTKRLPEDHNIVGFYKEED